MKKLSPDFKYLEEMYNDSYFPNFLVDKVKEQIVKVVSFLESGTHTNDEIQVKLDEMTLAINDLQEEFDQNASEIETAARDSIGTTVEDILTFFEIEIDIETAIQERDW